MEIDPKDFSVVWSEPRRGITWATVTHDPSGRSFRLKASKPVTDAWLATGEPVHARNSWILEHALTYLERALYEESAVGVQERLIEQARGHRNNVLASQEFCERLKEQYPAQADRVPTITITGGDN